MLISRPSLPLTWLVVNILTLDVGIYVPRLNMTSIGCGLLYGILLNWNIKADKLTWWAFAPSVTSFIQLGSQVCFLQFYATRSSLLYKCTVLPMDRIRTHRILNHDLLWIRNMYVCLNHGPYRGDWLSCTRLYLSCQCGPCPDGPCWWWYVDYTSRCGLQPGVA